MLANLRFFRVLGFGVTNVHVVIQESPKQKCPVDFNRVNVVAKVHLG
jgi:hypothetical protein